MRALEDIEKLGLLVIADREAGDTQTWVMTWYLGSPDPINVGVKGWPDDVAPLNEHDVDDLEDRGWVRVAARDGKARTYAITGAGRRAWAEWEASHAHVPGQVDLGWSNARALLEHLHRRYREAGAPELGIAVGEISGDSETEGPQAEALIRELLRDEFLEAGFASSDQAVFVRPTPKALRLIEGWPTGPAQDSLDELVQALDAAIDDTSDDDRRSRLVAVRDGVVGAGREVLLAYFEKKIVGL